MTTDNALADLDVSPSETFQLRRGGVLALTADHCYVVREGEDPITFAFEDLVEVRYSSLDWFITVTSLVLVGFGLYSTNQNVLGGLAFAAAGVASLYLTYRKRGKITFKISGRGTPLNVYPEQSGAAYESLDPLVTEDDD